MIHANTPLAAAVQGARTPRVYAGAWLAHISGLVIPRGPVAF